MFSKGSTPPLILHRRNAAFSLVELLTVMVILTLLAAFSVPALSSLNTSGRMNHAVVELAGILEQARQYAVSKNTYVWVAFHFEANPAGNSLSVAVLGSRDGTDQGTTAQAPSIDLDLLMPVRTFEHIQWSDAGTFTGLSGMPSSPATGAMNNVGTSSLKITVPGESTPATFTQAVKFQPSGEARNSASPIDVLEFAIQSKKPGVAANNDNVAVLRVNGLTGKTQVYRR